MEQWLQKSVVVADQTHQHLQNVEGEIKLGRTALFDRLLVSF